MVRLTLIARVHDGLPLAEGLDTEREIEVDAYKGQAKVGPQQSVSVCQHGFVRSHPGSTGTRSHGHAACLSLTEGSLISTLPLIIAADAQAHCDGTKSGPEDVCGDRPVSG